MGSGVGVLVAVAAGVGVLAGLAVGAGVGSGVGVLVGVVVGVGVSSDAGSGSSPQALRTTATARTVISAIQRTLIGVTFISVTCWDLRERNRYIRAHQYSRT